jgi:hypothetical protein
MKQNNEISAGSKDNSIMEIAETRTAKFLAECTQTKENQGVPNETHEAYENRVNSALFVTVFTVNTIFK